MIFDIFAWAFLARAPYPSSICYGVKKPQLFLIAGEGPDATNIQNIIIAEGYIQLGNAPNRPNRLQALSVSSDRVMLLSLKEETDTLAQPTDRHSCVVACYRKHATLPRV